MLPTRRPASARWNGEKRLAISSAREQRNHLGRCDANVDAMRAYSQRIAETTALAETRRDESYLADLVGEIPLLERGRPDKFPIRASLTLVLAGSPTALEGCAGSIEQLLNGEAQKF